MSSTTSTSSTLPYRIAPSAIAGRTLITTRKIQAGEIILNEQPIVCVAKRPDYSIDEIDRLTEPESFSRIILYAAAHMIQLPEDQQKQLKTLHKHQQITPKLSEVISILPKLDLKVLQEQLKLATPIDLDTLRLYILIKDTNAVEVGDDHSAIYLEFSRMNHSCRPTCEHHSNDDQRRVVRAVQYIPAHTELTINYIPQDYILHSTPARQAVVNSRLFACSCKRCIGIDRCRYFKCTQKECKDGKVAVTYSKTDKTGQLTCEICQHQYTEAERDLVFKREVDLYKRYKQLDENVIDSTTPEEDIRKLERIFSLVLDSQHWLMYELSKMKRDYYAYTKEWIKLIDYCGKILQYTIYAYNEHPGTTQPYLCTPYVFSCEQLGESMLSSGDRSLLESGFRLLYQSKNGYDVLFGSEHQYYYDIVKKIEEWEIKVKENLEISNLHDQLRAMGIPVDEPT